MGLECRTAPAKAPCSCCLLAQACQPSGSWLLLLIHCVYLRANELSMGLNIWLKA